MMKKIRSFFYLLGQGFIGVFRNSIMTTASVLVLVCCMLVMGTFGLVVKVIEKNFEQVDDLNVIVASCCVAVCHHEHDQTRRFRT